MLEILDVKRANYYKWLKHSKSERDLENEELADLVRKYDDEFVQSIGEHPCGALEAVFVQHGL